MQLLTYPIVAGRSSKKKDRFLNQKIIAVV